MAKSGEFNFRVFFVVLGNGTWSFNLALNADFPQLMGFKACIRLMILVLLLLESELLRASCITPNQVSTLEPFVGNSVGDPFSALQTTFPQVSPDRKSVV